MSKDWIAPYLDFAEPPTDIEPVFLGKKEYGSRAVLKRKGQRWWLQYERIPIHAVAGFLLTFGVALGLLLFRGDAVGLTVPDRSWGIVLMVGFLFLIAPTFLGLLIWINRHFAGRGELLVVTADDEMVTLPFAGLEVPWGSLHAVTEVIGWSRSSGETTRIRQIGLVWRTESGFRWLPLLAMAHSSGRLAARLGKLLHVPVLRARQPLLGKRRQRA